MNYSVNLLKKLSSRLHRQPALWILLFAFFCHSGTVSGQSKGATLTNLEAALGSKKVKALVIGVSSYKELPDHLQLKYGHSDAERFMKFLKKKATSADTFNLKLLTNNKATAGNIYSQLDWLLSTDVKDELVIIYFSGHGDVETKTIRERGFLLAYDTPAAGYHAGGTVRVSDLQDYISTLATNGATVLVITDACRSGKLAGGSTGLFATTAELEKLQKSTTKIMSSQAGELSWEDDRWDGGGGVFTYFLINGLEGKADLDNDGLVLQSELEIYLKMNVPKETGRKQNPVVEGGNASQVLFTASAPMAMASAAPAGKSRAKGKSGTNEPGAKANLLLDFEKAITKNDLITSTYSSAHAIYKKALATEKPVVVTYMRQQLISALVDDAQQVINQFMKGYNAGNATNIYHDAAGKLKIVMSLLDPASSRFKSYKARHLFLEAYAIFQNADQKKWPVGIFKLSEAVGLDPDAAYVHLALGQFYYYQKQPDLIKALTSYQAARRIAPTWTYPLASLGTYYQSHNQLDSAMHYYQKAIAINPEVATFHNNLGLVYFNQGKRKEALTHLDKAISLDAYLDDAYFNKATILSFTNRQPEAIQVLEAAVAKSENLPKSQEMLVNTYTTIAQNLLKNNEPAKAEAVIKKRITLEKPTRENQLFLAEAYYRQSEFNQAELALLKALSLYPNDKILFYELARVYAKKGAASQCASALLNAYRLGFQDSKLTDPAFDQVRDKPEIKEVVRFYKK